MQADFLLYNAGQMLTMAGWSHRPKIGGELSEIGLVGGGAVAAREGRIIAAGPEREVLRQVQVGSGAITVDAAGGVVLPGFVDPHTHVLYAGSREEEFSLKLSGVSYLEILRRGGGINYTFRQCRAAGDHDLKEQTRQRLWTMVGHGTTTVEVKSGYGLSVEEELRHLRLVRELAGEVPLDLVSTFMGAHAVPPEYAGRGAEYADLVAGEMLDRVSREGLAEFCDVFCEEGVFSVEESRRILARARELGLELKIHADELKESGGSMLAAELKARTAEHLLHVTTEGISALAGSGVMAVLLPGTSFYLRERYAPAREMIRAGVPVALATDANPGSCPCENMQLIINLACLYLGLSPEEAISAATINSAHAVRRGHLAGSMEAGKQADLVVLAARDYRYLAYHYGVNLARSVIKKGRLVTVPAE